MNNQKTAGLFVDASNIHYAFTNKSWKVDFQKLFNYINNIYNIKCAYYYEGTLTDKYLKLKDSNLTMQEIIEKKNKKNNYFKLLKDFGYKVVTKHINSIYDNFSGQMINKCNFDVELTINAIENIDNYEIFILASGDGDFIKLLKFLKGKFKKTIIISDKDRINTDLGKTANQTIFLEDIKDKIAYYKKDK